MRKTTYRSLLAAALLAVALPQAVAGNSQYIDNLPQLTQDPERPGAMTWVKPGFNRAAYTKVMIEPITIFISPDSQRFRKPLLYPSELRGHLIDRPLILSTGDFVRK